MPMTTVIKKNAGQQKVITFCWPFRCIIMTSFQRNTLQILGTYIALGVEQRSIYSGRRASNFKLKSAIKKVKKLTFQEFLFAY